MNHRILCVDDDSNILEGFQRQLRRRYSVDTALGGEEGLKRVTGPQAYAVVVSDLRMPGMDGIQFLSRVKEIAPDTTRIMLTGNADLNTAIEAVNEGNIFRFLTKPCTTLTLTKALEAGVRQFNLLTAEKELLEKTLAGSVKILADVLALTSPAAFGRAARVRRMVQQLSRQMNLSHSWQLEVAAMLSQVGCVTVPGAVLEKVSRGERLSLHEANMVISHPRIGHDLIANIPRLQDVAEIIAYQDKNYNGSGYPQDDVQGEDIPLESRVIHVALDYDTLVSGGKTPRQALVEMRKRPEHYDPEVLEALVNVIKTESRYETRLIPIDQLTTDMILSEDVETTTGLLLISKGQEVTPSLRERLRNFGSTMEIRQPIQVFAPARTIPGDEQPPAARDARSSMKEVLQ